MSVDAVSRPLAKALKEGSYSIPRHQRSYDWGEEQVNDLLDDLEFCVNNNREEHLLGTIMLIGKPNGSKWILNDGQQRLITYSMLCAQLCRYFRNINYSHGEYEMLRVLFKIQDGERAVLDEAQSYQTRIKASRKEKTTYETLLRGDDIRQNGKITAAWKQIGAFLGRYQDKWRKALMNFLLTKLKVILVYVSSDTDVTAVFETLNARGKPLEQIHLLRNYIYSHFGDYNAQEGETVENWITEINNIFADEKFEKYAHCYVQTQYGHVSSTRFYRDLKDRIDKKHKTFQHRTGAIFSLVKGLADKSNIGIFRVISSDAYRAADEILDDVTQKAHRTQSTRKMSNFVRDFRSYTVVHPVIFALLCRYITCKEKEKKKVAQFVFRSSKNLASFLQRITHVTSSFSPYHYEKQMAALAQEIMQKQCNTSNDFFKSLQNADREYIISDKVYKERMRAISFKTGAKKARYILARVIESDKQDVYENRCTIEHILPKSSDYASNWGFDDEQHKEYVHRLGNLTLLRQGDNRPQKKHNENFSAKKRIYAASGYKLTVNVGQWNEWTADTISERQQKLVETLAQIWNFEQER